jgi:hypothetical protein
MNEDRFETRSLREPRRSLHVLVKSLRDGKVRAFRSFTRGKIGLGVAVLALLGCCVIGLAVSSKRTKMVQQQSPQQKHINTLADQLSSLTQTDLIVFPDGRVWYVRAIHGRNMEVVGWVGDNVRSENVDSLVLKDDIFTIIRHNDPAWQVQRDRFLEQ